LIGNDGHPNADTPEFTLDTLTDVQLREYCRELEHSLKVIAPGAPVRSLLARKLFEVMDEQAARTAPESTAPEPTAPESSDSERPEGSEQPDEEIVSKS
jgi:hypothetical protein